MESKIISNIFSDYLNLDSNELSVIANYLTPRKIKRKQFLIKEGRLTEYAAFVLNGCLRSYSIDENGNEHILQFAPENWWITDMASYIAAQESTLYIDALIDSEVFLLSRVNQLKLFDEVPKLERYFRIITEKALVSSRQRVLDNMKLTARQRYQKFCKKYPTLVNTIPQKQIAAFIGITPEFLSKIRASR